MALQTVLLAVGKNDVDRIDELTQTVTDIAGPTGASVVIAHVFSEEEYDSVVDRLDFKSVSEADPDAVADRHSTVRDLRSRLDDAGIGYSVLGAVGDHGTEVVSLAEDANADLVIVGGSKRSPTGKAVFGSVAQEVMLNAPCPVTFVRDNS